MKHFLTFGQGKNFIAAAKRLLSQVISWNQFDVVEMFTDDDLRTDPSYWDKHASFTKKNRRGYGYFLWKPYLILKTLEKMKNGDILLYADGGCEVDVDDQDRTVQLQHLFEVVKEDKIIGSQCNRERNMNKMDILVYFDVVNNETILNSHQRQATAVLLYKCDETMDLVKKWYEIGSIYNYIDDSPSVHKNFDCFDEHRHDQSIFSLLTKTRDLYCTTESIESAIYILRNRTGNVRRCVGVTGTQFWCPGGNSDIEQIEFLSKMVKQKKPTYVMETGFGIGHLTASLLLSCSTIQVYLNCCTNNGVWGEDGKRMRQMFKDFFPKFHSFDENPKTFLQKNEILGKMFPKGIDWLTLGESIDLEQEQEQEWLDGIVSKMNNGGILFFLNNSFSKMFERKKNVERIDFKRMTFFRKISDM